MDSAELVRSLSTYDDNASTPTPNSRTQLEADLPAESAAVQQIDPIHGHLQQIPK